MAAARLKKPDVEHTHTDSWSSVEEPSASLRGHIFHGTLVQTALSEESGGGGKREREI